MKPGTEAILDFLRMRGRRGATSRDVWFGGGGSRLAARVRELRVDGYRIETRLETHDGARFARYVLQDPEREPVAPIDPSTLWHEYLDR